MARNDYTMPPAGIAAAESQRAREGGVALTGNLAGPTSHHTVGSLMQVGISSASSSVSLIRSGVLSTIIN